MSVGAIGEELLASCRECRYHYPTPVTSGSEVASLLARFRELSDQLRGRSNQAPNLLFPRLRELVRDPRIRDPVESVVCPELLRRSCQFFSKPAGNPGTHREIVCREDTSAPGYILSRAQAIAAEGASGCVTYQTLPVNGGTMLASAPIPTSTIPGARDRAPGEMDFPA